MRVRVLIMIARAQVVSRKNLDQLNAAEEEIESSSLGASSSVMHELASIVNVEHNTSTVQTTHLQMTDRKGSISKVQCQYPSSSFFLITGIIMIIIIGIIIGIILLALLLCFFFLVFLLRLALLLFFLFLFLPFLCLLCSFAASSSSIRAIWSGTTLEWTFLKPAAKCT